MTGSVVAHHFARHPVVTDLPAGDGYIHNIVRHGLVGYESAWPDVVADQIRQNYFRRTLINIYEGGLDDIKAGRTEMAPGAHAAFTAERLERS